MKTKTNIQKITTNEINQSTHNGFTSLLPYSRKLPSLKDIPKCQQG